MSYGNTPPPGGPSDSPKDSGDPGYGAPPPPPGYGTPPPPPPAYGTPPPPPPAYGSAPQYGSAPPPAYGQPSAQGVGTLALWPQRALGYLIDVALYIPGYILMGIGIPKVDAATNTTSGFGVLYFVGLLYILGIAIWNRWIKGGTTGQTIGRGVLGTKLISEKTGQPVGPGMAFVRDLAHIVDAVICYVGFLFPLWDSKRQTLADKIVSTVVVTSPKGS